MSVTGTTRLRFSKQDSTPSAGWTSSSRTLESGRPADSWTSHKMKTGYPQNQSWTPWTSTSPASCTVSDPPRDPALVT